MHHVVPRLSGTPASIRTPAPKLGEHNRALLKELGIEGASYAALVREGIVCESGTASAEQEE
jgi:formyl-CoA transferase